MIERASASSRWAGFFGLICLFFVSGCGNYTATTRSARDEFYAGKYTEAAKALEKGAREEGVDQLLYVLDRATALHHAGDYEESIKEFALADKLAEIKDYTSLSAEAATFLTNDKIIQYKGEDFEKVLISQYQAMNYLMLGKHEDALVECRRVNHKLQLMISEGKRKYRLNPFASYLAALLYEDQGEWDHAYIDYQAVQRLAPDYPLIGEDLYRLAWKNNIRDDMEKWAEQYKLTGEDQRRIREQAKLPEVVVILENGKAPEKQPNPQFTRLPHFVPRYNSVVYAEVAVNGDVKTRTQPLFNVEQALIENLNEKYGLLIAKRVAGIVAKEVVAQQVSKRTDPLLGLAVWIGMHAADQADLRSWLTLPRDFQIARIRVPTEAPAEGYKVQVFPRAGEGRATAGGAPAVVEKLVHFPAAKPFQKTAPRAFIPVRVL